MIHYVKSWPKFFNQIIAGTRFHELRENDRDYQVGDEMVLQEFNPALNSYTGRSCTVKITSITSDEHICAVSQQGLHPDYCILSIHVVT